MSTKIKINGRVILDGIRGYIRWLSDKTETGKVIVGIELDRPIENGTNGIYKDKQYFSCPDGCAIFEEYDDESILQNSFLKAIEYAYIKGYVDDDDVVSIVPTEREGTVSLILGKIGGKDIEFLSNDHQEYKVKLNENLRDNLKPSKYCRCITISNYNIRIVEDDNNLYEQFEAFFDATEIDISDNLIESWRDVEKILKKFKYLEILSLSRNPINTLFDCTDNVYENLKSISLNYTSFKWESVIKIGNQLPNLEEIYLCYNEIENIPDTINGERINFDKSFIKLSYVNLEGNKIKQWENLKGLSNIKSLQKLVLSFNNLSSINFNGDGFQNLKSLSLNGCPITEWKEIEKLNEFKSLNELYIKKIGLLSKCGNYENILRQNIISILFNLEKINGGDITKKEREDSERYYYTQFLKIHPNSDLQSLKKIDFTFNRLFQKYEDIIVSMYTKMYSTSSIQTKSNTFITVTLRNEDSSLTFEKKLPKTTTILKLKTLVSKLFKCDVQELSLYIDEQNSEKHLLEKIESNVDSINDYTKSDTLSILCTW